MIEAGRGGSIINISSIAGALALGRGNLAHSANKGAVNQMTKELAVEWAKYGIRVNAILPCQVLTEGFQKWLDSPSFDPAMMDSFLRGIPMNRLVKPEDMAKLKAAFKNGWLAEKQCVIVFKSWTMQDKQGVGPNVPQLLAQALQHG